ncbi:hypothetical protein [Floridanema evergladense]|uniref:Uncharacterized protein n=1 Tax=Floridaenema evergladense BLCC-F167 TaxID=3153639 RepID=A0ABV4WXC0_9CYAN
MSKLFQFALLTLALQPLPALAQIQTEYGFPIAETSAKDLPCHMVTNRGNTLDLTRLCSGSSRTVTRSAIPVAQRVPVQRKRLGYSGFEEQYDKLAKTYPEERVRNMLSSSRSYTESVCKRLEEGKSLEQIRTEDVEKLNQQQLSNLMNNVGKQNIEITLKVAPQYYCPEN